MPVNLTPEETADVRAAVDVLRRGGVILYPTDTVWGLGCDATNATAVKRVFQIKQRSDSKALIALVNSLAMLERTVDNVPEVAYQLIEASDRPTTIVYDHGSWVAPEMISADGSLAVRVSSERISSAIIRGLGRPLVSTSANISGSPAATFFDQISEEIKNTVDYACCSRRSDRTPSQPSLIIKISDNGVFKILRK